MSEFTDQDLTLYRVAADSPFSASDPRWFRWNRVRSYVDLGSLAHAASMTLIILISGVSGCVAPVKDPSLLLDLIPISTAFEPTTPIGADVYPAEQEAFVRGVTAKAHAMGYHVTSQRIFVFVGYVREIGPQWVVLHAELGNPLFDTYHAKEIDRHVSLSEPAASSIWRIRARGVIALAQSHTMPDGNALVGYFALEK